MSGVQSIQTGRYRLPPIHPGLIARQRQRAYPIGDMHRRSLAMLAMFVGIVGYLAG